MRLLETLRLIARGLIRLGQREDVEAAKPLSSPFKALEFETPEIPVYSLREPAPVWRREFATVPHGPEYPAPPEYPRLSGEAAGQNREDVAELVYRRVDFDSRLASQPMDGEA